MNIKHRLTVTMWALPFTFIMIVFGKTIPVIGAGVVLMGLQMILWHKLLSEIKKLISSSNLPINRLKKCKTCSNSKNSSPPSELSGGMSFELTKD